MLSNEKARLIIKICNLYYYEGLTQQEISNKLGIDRPQISRMLTTAKSEGIVNITIKNPYSEEHEIEKALVQEFGISDVIIVDTYNYDELNIFRQFANEATLFLDEILKENDILGISAGNTINIVSEEIGYLKRKGLQVVPLVGGWGPHGDRAQSNLNARNFGEHFNCRYYQLDAPAFVASSQIRNDLLNEPTIHAVLEIARKSSVAIVSIGRMSEDEMVVESGPLSREKVRELIQNGAIASLVGSFVDETGTCIEFSESSSMIGLEAKELKKIPKVIAIAHGVNKVNAIKAVFKGQYVNLFMTNLLTAKSLLSSNGLKAFKTD